MPVVGLVGVVDPFVGVAVDNEEPALKLGFDGPDWPGRIFSPANSKIRFPFFKMAVPLILNLTGGGSSANLPIQNTTQLYSRKNLLLNA